MLAEESRTRQERLKSCLYQLALTSSQFGTEQMQSTAQELQKLYADGFRHSYSEFFPLIVDISKDTNDYSTDLLAERLYEISNYIELDYVNGDGEYKKLYRHVLKLCDHLNLEIGRLNYYAATDSRVKDVEIKVKESEKSLRDAETTLEIATSKASSLQTEILTVLSIFSAVVLAFMGGMSFTSSTLESINKASIYKVTFIAIICGFVVFNTICGLMYLVAKVTGRNIYTICSKPNCSCAEHPNECTSIDKLKLRLPYVYWVDVVLVSLLFLVVLAWALDLHEAVIYLRNVLPWHKI